jgi:hypothetical protein
LSGSEPHYDPLQTDEKPGASSSPPGLVFKPDVQQAVRVARVRMFSLLAAAILMIIALVLIISYRPPPVKITNSAAPRDSTPPVESVAPASPRSSSPSAPAPRPIAGVEIARSVVAAVDTLVNAAGEKWARASELAAQGTVTRDNAQQAADGFRRAALLADSARRDIQSARQRGELVRSASRQAESRLGFRLSVLYTAIDRYLKSLDEDAADRQAYYVKLDASAQALLADDAAESETQQNVAMSYLRHSEDRQAGLKRLADQMREAQRNIDDAGR